MSPDPDLPPIPDAPRLPDWVKGYAQYADQVVGFYDYSEWVPRGTCQHPARTVLHARYLVVVGGAIPTDCDCERGLITKVRGRAAYRGNSKKRALAVFAAHRDRLAEEEP